MASSIHHSKARQAYSQIPRRSKATDPKTYTKIPHQFGDLLIRGGKFSGQLQIELMYLIGRETIGAAVDNDETRPEWCRSSYTAFAKRCRRWDSKTGRLRDTERKSIVIALADLVNRGLIVERDRTGCGKTTIKMYKWGSFEQWRNAPAPEPSSKAELEAADAEAEESIEEPVPEGDAATEAEQTVANGKLSRPQPVSVKPGRNQEPVTIRLVYRPTGFEFAVRFRARTGANGRIQVSAEPCRGGEEKGKNYGHPRPQFENSFVEDKRFIEFEELVSRVSLEVWGIAPDNAFVQRIAETAGGATAEELEKIARRKFAGRDAAARYTKGIWLELAKDAAQSRAKKAALEFRRAAAAAGWANEARNAQEGAFPPQSEPVSEPCEVCQGKKRVTRQNAALGRKVVLDCEACGGTGRKERK
jgi:hypothetical protein